MAVAVGIVVVGTPGDRRGNAPYRFRGKQSTPVLLIAAAVYSFGAVLARPGQETLTANLASPSARGAYFGVASLSFAFGGGLGNYLGDVFFDIGQYDNLSLLPWMVLQGWHCCRRPVSFSIARCSAEWEVRTKHSPLSKVEVLH